MNFSQPLCFAFLWIPGISSAGVLAHYSFDTNFNDSSGNEKHGTLFDTGTPGNSQITTAPGEHKFGGGAMRFDATDADRVDIPQQSLTTDWTVAFWAKRAATDKWDLIIGQTANSNHFIGLGTPGSDNSGPMGIRWRGTASGAGTSASYHLAPDTEWHHYAFTASDGTVTIYRDGIHFATDTGNTSTNFIINTIGNPYNSNAYSFRGKIDEVWIFDEALDANAVAALFHSNDPEGEPPPPPPPVTRLRVLLIGGQSNADGRAEASGLPADLQIPRNEVPVYYKARNKNAELTTLQPGLSQSTSQFGPEILLGHRFANLYQDEEETRVALIKYANGGTNLHTQWKAGGDATTTGDGAEYVVFQQTVNDGLAALAAAYPDAEIKLETMVWMQGESDAANPHSGNYGTNLTAFIADVRATFGASLPFIIGRLSNAQTNITTAHLAAVQTAQDTVAAADPLTGIVNTNGFGMKNDNLHFDAAGQQAMGSAFAEEAAYYSWMVKTFTPADIAAGLAEPDADHDGDGQSNRNEFLSGSDPLSGVSLFRAWFVKTEPDTGQISYTSSASRMYLVQKYSEESRTWEQELPALRGSGGTVVRTLETPRPRSIYRVSSGLP